MTTPTSDPTGLPPFTIYAGTGLAKALAPDLSRTFQVEATAPEPAEDVRPLSLPDLLVHLEHVVDDLEMAEQDLTLARHNTEDSARIVELHATASDLNMAWAYVKRARAALEALAATP